MLSFWAKRTKGSTLRAPASSKPRPESCRSSTWPKGASMRSAGREVAGWWWGGGVGRCCQLCEILVRKQSEKDFCNLFKSRATFSIQAKAMSKAGKARCGMGREGREVRAGLRERQAASLATCSSSCHLPDLIWNSK